MCGVCVYVAVISLAQTLLLTYLGYKVSCVWVCGVCVGVAVISLAQTLLLTYLGYKGSCVCVCVCG